MNIWHSYTKIIKANCASRPGAVKDLAYLRNNLFANTIIYLLPFCLIALIPGVYWGLVTGLYVVVLSDSVIVTSLVLLAFVPGISIIIRKIIFIICMYVLSCVLLYHIGLSGSGQVYLLSASIFSVLIFTANSPYWSAFLNALICLIFGLAIPFGILPWPHNLANSAGAWIAVSSSTVFLSFLAVALIPRLFSGLQDTIENEKKLLLQLSQKQDSLGHAIKMMEQKNTELEQFAYAASHDLQEPLRMVTGFLTQLEKKYAGTFDDKAKQYIHFAVDGAQRMRCLISDLLEFSRIGRIEDQLGEVDLNKVINEIEMLYRAEINSEKAVILTGELPVIYSCRSAVTQVFQNLIGNALKYSNENLPAQINISAQEQEKHWQFAVTDNGIGIAQEYVEKIFIIFQRLHDREKYSGTGIGLAITKKIIENMGGKIWVKSEVDKGSTFYFTILKNTNL
jgi:signal transduction histidine kinase